MGDRLKWESRERLGLVLLGMAIGFVSGGVFASMIMAPEGESSGNLLLFWVFILVPMALLGIAFVLFSGYEKNRVVWEREERKRLWESINKR